MDEDRSAPDVRRPPMAVVIGGAPGSGKSTIGGLVARASRAALLDLDTLTNPLVARIAALTGAGDDLDHPSLQGAVREARYACLRDTAVEVLAGGCPVVVVAPFTRELHDPAVWQQFSDRLGTALLVALTIDPAESLRRRLSRGEVRDRKLVDSAVGSGVSTVGVHVDLVLDGAAASESLVAEILGSAGVSARS